MTARTQMILMFAAAAALTACETEGPTEAEIDEVMRAADVEAGPMDVGLFDDTSPRDTLRSMAADEDCPLRGVFLGVSQDGSHVALRRRATGEQQLTRLGAPMEWTDRGEAQVTGRWESPSGAIGKLYLELRDPAASAGTHGVVTGMWARAESHETQGGSVGGVWRDTEEGGVELIAYWTGC